MDDEIRGAMGTLIRDSIEAANELEPGSEQKAKEVENVAKLYKAAMEDVKTQLDYDERQTNHEIQEKEAKKDRIFKGLLEVGKVTLSAAFLSGMAKKVMKFEEFGSVTSFAGREVIKKALNFLKI